ncbi:hypothetical protein MNBD_PLANCTO02-2690 [hydrothermal vent metagenome]|uniref:Uncharacterized protein n=1 Tax=hydrothermal vent metagenome TaxID=652676 RepID=A0A3B1D717_9ZZZZ
MLDIKEKPNGVMQQLYPESSVRGKTVLQCYQGGGAHWGLRQVIQAILIESCCFKLQCITHLKDRKKIQTSHAGDPKSAQKEFDFSLWGATIFHACYHEGEMKFS